MLVDPPDVRAPTLHAATAVASPPAPATGGQVTTGAATDFSLPKKGGYLGQFDSYRVVACGAVVLQHSLLWTIQPGNEAAWAFVMLLHFSRTAFFFLSALLLTYSQITRPRSVRGFWARRYVQLGVPYLAWTAIYWGYTLAEDGSWDRAGYLLWHDLVFGYYQLYFVVVLLQLYVVFPFLLRLIRRSRHHARIMTVSLLFALFLAAVLHWQRQFGSLGHFTLWFEHYWPWARNPITYQEQFVAGILVALHLDQVRRFASRWYRQVIAGAVVLGIAATMWYLVAVWTGSPTGGASDLYQPIAFLWFTAAVAGLECGTWWWYQRTQNGHPPRSRVFSARYLGALTGGIFFSHVLVINFVRQWLGDLGISAHLGWGGEVVVLWVLTLSISAAFVALLLRTPLRWVLGGPVRAEQRARLDALAGS